MKRLLFFITINIFFGSLAIAQKPTAATAQASALENSLLWEISGKGLQAPSYLFGTIHMIDKKDFILTDVTKSSLEKTKRVAFEINMEEMSDISVLMPLMMKAFMADGKTLSDLLNDEDYTLVKNHFEKMGLPMMMLERMKPMFLSAMNPESMNMGSGEDSGMMSYEVELMDLAKAQKKSIAGLETAEYQMSMFDSIPYEAQAKMLVESVKSGSTGGDDELQKLVDLYKNQDLNGLSEMLSADGDLSKYEDLLLVRRNKNWIPVMGKMMSEQATFFAVGAGHLAGKQGVITLLREAGYTLKPLK